MSTKSQCSNIVLYSRGERLQTKVTCIGQHKAQFTDQCTEFLHSSKVRLKAVLHLSSARPMIPIRETIENTKLIVLSSGVPGNVPWEGIKSGLAYLGTGKFTGR